MSGKRSGRGGRAWRASKGLFCGMVGERWEAFGKMAVLVGQPWEIVDAAQLMYVQCPPIEWFGGI
ncbi:hypothetical protein TorRG33x02_053460 [Trema orientale]|uniref:Uncharacterized protein n=1 Tax=Trema orientale TaxID=63057 RepID=A0A2P5FLQ5_TREOI|nr:hypothetical protein TorRG33x02_053460 [Trema orientale]